MLCTRLVGPWIVYMLYELLDMRVICVRVFRGWFAEELVRR